MQADKQVSSEQSIEIGSQQQIPSSNNLSADTASMFEGESQGYLQNQSMSQLSDPATMKIMSEKANDLVLKFRQAYRQMKKDRDNKFTLKSPTSSEIGWLVEMWRTRPNRTDKFYLDLEITESDLPIDKVIQLFNLFPSIRLTFNEQKIQNKNIFQADEQCVYQGSNQFMSIVYIGKEQSYNGQVANKQPNGKGRMVIMPQKKQGYVNQGIFIDGRMEGKGVQRTNKLLLYRGQFKNDLKHGFGVEQQMKKKKNPNKNDDRYMIKSRYTGEFVEGWRHGKGKEETGHGNYEGQWENGVKKGQGRMEYKNGDQYEGEWENNQFSGTGTYREFQNSTYKGEFKNGKYNGQGVMEYDNGDKYEGEWKDGKKSGKGMYTWADGDYYDGEWLKDSADGVGTSMMGDDFYDGEFKNGKRHGMGELTDGEGNMTKALWENGEIKITIQINGEPVQNKE